MPPLSWDSVKRVPSVAQSGASRRCPDPQTSQAHALGPQETSTDFERFLTVAKPHAFASRAGSSNDFHLLESYRHATCNESVRGLAPFGKESRLGFLHHRSSFSPSLKGNNVSTDRLVKIIRPPLHQLDSLFQIKSVVVARRNTVSLLMGKLRFNMRMVKSIFMQHCRSKSAKSVPRHPTLKPHSLKRLQDCIVADRPLLIPLTREQ